jgi:type IV secretion system protein VirB1
MTALIRVESGGRPLAIHDNTLHRSFAPRDANQGVAWANQLLRLHHSVDLGLSQINDVNLPRLAMSVRDAFDPCINVHGGATILAADYRMASSRFGPGQFALRHAIGAYNSGSLFAGYSYVEKILQAAGIADSDVVVPDLLPLAASLPRANPAAQPAPAPVPSAPVAVQSPAPPVIPDPYRSPILTGTSTAAPAVQATSDPTAPVVLTPTRSSILPTQPQSASTSAPTRRAPAPNG